MYNLKKIRIVAISAFLISITSLGIGYSSLNSTLEIDGVAKVVTNDKELVYRVNLSEVSNVITSDEDTTITDTKIDGSIISFNTKLNGKGSLGSFITGIKNTGDVDAVIKNIFITGNEEYKDKVSINIEGLKVGDVIKPGESIDNVKVNVLYLDDGIETNYDYYGNPVIESIVISDVKINIELDK